MKKALIIIMAMAMVFAFCSCGSDESADAPETPEYYTPIDIQVEATDEGPVFSVIYDIDNEDKEQWSGYDSKENEVLTAVNGIKECMAMDEWENTAVVYGYGKEPKLANMLYSYGAEGDYSSIGLYQLGIYNESYILQGELD